MPNSRSELRARGAFRPRAATSSADEIEGERRWYGARRSPRIHFRAGAAADAEGLREVLPMPSMRAVVCTLCALALFSGCPDEPTPRIDAYRPEPRRGPALVGQRATPDAAPVAPLRRPRGDLIDPGHPPIVFRVLNSGRVSRSFTRLAGASEVRIEERADRRWVPIQSSPGRLRACEAIDRVRLGDAPAAGEEVVVPGAQIETLWRGFAVVVARGADAQPCAQTLPASRGHYRATVFGCGPVEFDLPSTGGVVQIRCQPSALPVNR